MTPRSSLRGGAYTVGELVERLELPQTRISSHLACLRHYRFVQAERQGREIVHRRALPDITGLIAIAQEVG